MLLTFLLLTKPAAKHFLSPIRVPEECPQATADVVEQCLHEDADVRPSAREIVDKLSQLKEPSQT